MFKSYRNLWLSLGLLIILTPLGLLATGTAYGEWGLKQLEEKLGFIPKGLAKFSDIWPYSIMPDYAMVGLNNNFFQSAVGYIISAVVGVTLIIIIMSFIARVIKD